MNKDIFNIPLIPLRGLTIFPSMVMHFDVGREKSIAAIEEAMIREQKIFLAAQKEAKIDDPKEEDIFKVGTVCLVKQIVKMPNNTMRVLVEGIERGTIKSYCENDKFIEIEVETNLIDDIEDSKELEALIRFLKEQFISYLTLSKSDSIDSILNIEDIEKNPSEFADIVASFLPLKQDTKQEILELFNIQDRIEKLLIIIKNEIEILQIEKKISTKVKTKIDKLQKEYYLREQIKIIQEELGEDDQEKKEIDNYQLKINKAKLPKEVKERAIHELSRLKSSGTYSSEGNVIRTYLDLLLDIPWTKETKDTIDIKKARGILDTDHYGMKDVKERIIEYLAIKHVSKSLKGPILCLVGPPGVGKTSIAKSVAKALNRKFVRISLGGMKDEAEIRGHRRTYVGAIPGRIIYGIKQANSKNPLFLLDEIDKMSKDFKGDPADALLEVLDAEQNFSFRDNYLELEFDLSKVLFITTANSLDTIPRPLLDRMEIIELSGYTYEEKYNIAKKYLIEKQIKEHGLINNQIKITDNAIKKLIENYTKESGVRNLERTVGTVIRKSITEMLEKNKKNMSINSMSVEKYLGPKIFTYDKVDKEDKIGVVTGMAWTAYGGDTLPVEVMVMNGTGKLELTGQLGDVMKESAKAAYTYVRANCKEYGIKEDFYKTKDIHIHAPEGAVPKDGPSAGVTMITALVSSLSNKKVKHNIAMTGEITLTGLVLPIGGLKEKSLAAYRAGIDTVIVPKENEKDIKDIPNSVKSKLKFIFVSKVEEVLKNALVSEEKHEN